MASDIVGSSSSSSKYDVFLSFRGIDTRYGFTGHLFESLQAGGLYTFMDTERKETGERLDSWLYKAVEDSTMCIAVISEHYADSRWCLRELSKFVEWKKKVIPIFYYVSPSDVREQVGKFQDAFSGYDERSRLPKDHIDHVTKEDVENWRRTLSEVGNLQGYYDLHENKDRNEARLIRDVVHRVLVEFDIAPLDVANHAVGIDSKVHKMLGLLGMEDGKDAVKIVGLHGMVGVGKTTVAKALYNKISKGFDASCIVMDVREEARSKQGLIGLQMQVIAQLLNARDAPLVVNVEEGIAVLRKISSLRRVLLVLDDVDKREQVMALAGGRDWLGQGSRIVITTRDRRVLENLGVGDDEMYHLEGLSEEESLQLLSWHAFGRNEPTEEFMAISKHVVSYTSGLPLVLEILGSYLCGKRDPKLWEEKLEESTLSQDGEVEKRLRTSYDELEEELKLIFLDIACFFVGEDSERVIDLLKACGLPARSAMEDLLNKSLLKIDGEKKIWMHDQLKCLAANIIRKESTFNAGQRSRIKEAKEVCSVLGSRLGTEKMEGICVTGDSIKGMRREAGTTFSTDAFMGMSKLRFLLLRDVNLQGDFSKIPKNVILLSWLSCPLKSLPGNFPLKSVRYLDLRFSLITQLWSRHALKDKVLYELRFLDLSYCKQLTTLPDFSCMPNLEKLKLEFCIKLFCIPDTIGQQKRLVELHINRCFALRKLPCSISNAESLTKFIVANTGIEELPNSIGRLTNLEKLSAKGCRNLKLIPESVGSLTKLDELDLSFCNLITELPDSIYKLKNLSKLMLPTRVKCRPDWIRSLDGLKSLSLTAAGNDEVLNGSFRGLSMIEELNLGTCHSLEPALDIAQSLAKLSTFEFGVDRIEEMPDSMGSFENLKTLRISFTSELKSLPDSLWSLTKLEELSLTCLKPEEDYNSQDCESSLISLPESIGKLGRLLVLIICNLSIQKLPESIAGLVNLKDMRILNCAKLKGPIPLWEMEGLKYLTFDSSEVVDEEDEIEEAYKDVVEVSGCSEPTQEYRRILPLDGHLRDFAVWELTLAVGNCQRAIKVSTSHECKSKKWVGIIFSNDFVVESVKVNKKLWWKDVMNKFLSFCPCLA